MLFSDLACFSPDVPNTIKKLWVANGGTLTHTSTDFQNARFFFCNDAKDPWLNELLSRSLIVRHASWVVISVAEGFRMPIAQYTLDDAFDESQIPNVGILKSVRNTHENITASPSADDRPILPGSLAKPYMRKRPFEPESDSAVSSHQRPKKKARVEVIDRSKDARHEIGIQKSSDQTLNSDLNLRHISLPFVMKKMSESGKVLRAVEVFQKHVAERRALAPPTAPKKPRSEMLAPHTVFWNDLLAKCYPRDGRLDLSIGDLLQAPDTNAAIFDVNETYLGRRFVNLQSR